MLPIFTRLKPVNFIVTDIELKEISLPRFKDNKEPLLRVFFLIILTSKHDNVRYLLIKLEAIYDLQLPFLPDTSPYFQILLSTKAYENTHIRQVLDQLDFIAVHRKPAKNAIQLHHMQQHHTTLAQTHHYKFLARVCISSRSYDC